MRTIRKRFTALLLSIFYLLLSAPAHAGLPEAVAYLKAQPQDEWITQALRAAGEAGIPKDHLTSFSGSSATDYAKRILGVVAAGENPQSFAGVNLVAGLKGLAQAGQLGDPALLNDDAWGIIALRAAGVAASDPVVAGAKAHLLANQRADGGWGWGVGFGSDTNDTAAVLMALTDVGLSSSDAAVASALAYLKTQQAASGGFAYQLPCSWPACEDADAASTSWVASALAKLGLDPASWVVGSSTPLSFLAGLQTDDGSFKWQAADPAGSAGMTAFALVALLGKFYPVAHLTLPDTVAAGGRAPIPIADLALRLSSPVASEGGSVTYTVTLENRGPNVASEVVVEGVVPPGFHPAAAQASEGAYQPDTNRWELAGLSSVATLTLAVAPQLDAAPGTVSATIRASAREYDPDQTNNMATATLEVVAPTPAEPAEGEVTLPPAVLGQATASCAGQSAPLPQGTAGGFAVSPEAPQLAWYWDAATGTSHCLGDDASVRRLFERLALGITNENLGAVVPGSVLGQRLTARLLLQVEAAGEVWYVGYGGTRTYLPPTAVAIELIHSLVGEAAL